MREASVRWTWREVLGSALAAVFGAVATAIVDEARGWPRRLALPIVCGAVIAAVSLVALARWRKGRAATGGRRPPEVAVPFPLAPTHDAEPRLEKLPLADLKWDGGHLRGYTIRCPECGGSVIPEPARPGLRRLACGDCGAARYAAHDGGFHEAIRRAVYRETDRRA